MATLLLMCGLPGSGKTTLAERLEREALRLTPGTFHVTDAQLDAWWQIFEPPTADELRPRAEKA